MDKEKINDIEKEILKRVWNRVKTLSVIVASILTVGGIFSYSELKDSIAEKAAEKFKNDIQLRDKIENEIINNANFRIEELEIIKGEINKISNDLEKERILAQKILARDLSSIRIMLERIRSDTLKNEN